ncbi:MAG: sigma-70 family RNA polymerase sigma factor [Spirochaetaceae bacterium]|nr:sigma-70 family RNA polymerase sigma factor [Spirochaetaceae bacterium]
MEPCDEEIAAEVVAGQRDLFRLLIDRHERHITGMGFSFFHNADAAADFTQDVFLKAFLALSHFEGRARFSTWLYRIAYTSALNQLNRKKEYKSLCENEYESPCGTPEEDHIKALLRDAVKQAVAGLPEKYRVCVDLFFFYERSYDEIGVITGYPVNTIKSHVFRAKKILREKLKSFVEGGIP